MSVPDTRLRWLLAVWLWCLAPAQMVAESAAPPTSRSLDRTLEARPRGQVLVRHLSGSLEVRGWDRDEVRISATLGPGARDLHTRSDGQRIWIEVEPTEDPEPGSGEARMVVSLPRGSQLQVRAASTRIELFDLTGPIDLEATSGTVVLTNEPDTRADEVSLTTVSGDITVATTCRILRVRSVEGSLHIDHPSPDLQAETATGDIFHQAPVLRESRLESGSGRIRVEGSIAAIGRLRVFSHEGPVELRFPGDTEALFEVETGFGSILADPDSPTGEHQGQGTWRRRTGNTEAQVYVRSFRGDIHLSRFQP